MAQRFFENTLVSQFIKNIVANAPVPVISTANYYDYIIQGNFYVLVDKIIRCDKSGYVESSDSSKRASYTDIQHFEFGRAYPQLTETYFSNESYYDSETHKHLGKFLRCLRDTKYIDLMPFYNCFNYRTTKGSLVYDDSTHQVTYSQESQSQYKLFIVPITLNKTYTIYMDAGINVTMLPVLYTEDRELKGEDGSFLSESHYKEGEAPGPLGKYFPYVKFTTPITYKLDSSVFDNEDVIGNLEKYLNLFVQVPKNCISSIVILEGDYTDVESEKVYDCSEKDQVVLNKLLLKNLSLTLANSKTISAFSDKLVEFLLLAVINSLDDISNDILRVQELAGMSKVNGYIPSVWTPTMRRKFFETYLNKNYVDGTFKTDVTGFVDSRVEKMLLQGEYLRINKGDN